MLLRLIYDDKLAQAAYLIGCQHTGEAVIFDPERDVDRYVDLARREGLRIVAAAETHIHADFLSGVRELAHFHGARAYVSGEGGDQWSPRWLDEKPAQQNVGAYDAIALRDDDTFTVGEIEFRVIHTPGHTPEHLCYLVTDRGGGATQPMGLVSGDFLFVGDVGRPDLLETAAGIKGVAESAARQLYRSIEKLRRLPDWLQVWPGHGAGSACGKALGAVPQTTVGYERLFNPALRAAGSEEEFVRFVLAGQPEPPMYFARMKRDNRDGPELLDKPPRPDRVNPADLPGDIFGDDTVVIDTRPWKMFRAGHIAGSIYAPLDSLFPSVVGSFIEPENAIYVVAGESRTDEIVRDCVRIGLDRVKGFIDPGDAEAAARNGGRLATAPEMSVGDVSGLRGDDRPFFLDVRRATEFVEGHLPGATHVPYTRLAEGIEKLPRNRRVIVNCRSGGRSARAVSYLRRKGFNAINLEGGYLAWEKNASS